MNKKRGFTLVELIIVIAVIGVLAAILIPVFANVIENSNSKSALSDAKNTITGFIGELQTDEVVDIPDLVVAVHKGSRLYVYAYSAEEDNLLECNSNPFDYNKKASVRSNSVPVLGKLEEKGVLRVDASAGVYPVAYTTKYIKEAGYDTKEIAIFTDYVVEAEGFTTVEKLDIAEIVPDDPPEYGQLVIEPVYDATEEVFVYTITPDDADMMTYSTKSSFELNLKPIMDSLNEKAAMNSDDRWYGYGIKVVDESNMGYTELSMKFTNETLAKLKDGTQILDSARYPYITNSVAFTNYMTDELGYAEVSETTVGDYIANAGSVSKTYAQYLSEEYGATIPVDKLAEVCSGERIGTFHHTDAAVAKIIFDCMYSNGFVYSFIPDYVPAEFGRYLSAYDAAKTGMADGWKTSGDVKFYSVYDLIGRDTLTGMNFTGGTTTRGAIMLAWHENVVPQGSAFEAPNVHMYVNTRNG